MKQAPFFFSFLFLLVVFSCNKNSHENYPNSPSPCNDGIQDNGETGVDCGGPCSACPKQWTAVASGTLADLYCVQFADTMNGWAVGMNGTIIRSSDGGNTWSAQISGITDTLFSVSFINSSTGWIAGNKTILKTTNGGATWSISDTASINQAFYTVCFIDANNGWIGGTNTGYTFMNYTSDGGVVWQQRFMGQSINQHGSIRSIHFVNTLTGFAVGEGTLGVAIHTTDGGSSWSAISMTTPTSLYACDFTSVTDGWATGVHNFYYDANLVQWHYQTFLPENDTLRGVKLISTGLGWAVGNGGRVYKRTATFEWTSVANISTTNNLYSVSASDNSGCIVGQAGTVYILK